MRQLSEILRLKHELGLSHAQIARALDLSKGVVSKYLSLATAQSVSWPLLTEGVLAAHAVTTLHYLISRYQNRQLADRATDWLLRRFSIASVGVEVLRRARGLGWNDFEDAVVAAAAEASGCRLIVTRNVKDFGTYPVEARTPDEYLLIPNR